MEHIFKFLEGISPREYQKKIFETCSQKNCLVVLPTGLGKTLIALMVAIDRMHKYPGEKILFLAPTRPLVEQHLQTFKKLLPELFAEITIFTGKIKAEERKKLWQRGDIVFSTPQCIDKNTLIFTEEGPMKISEFFKKFEFTEKKSRNKKWKEAEINKKVLGFDGKETRFVNASKALKLPGKEMLKIKTEIGNSINCTKDHPILTINEEGDVFWKEAYRLEEGDYIASTKKINPTQKNPEIMNLLSQNKKLKVVNKNITKKILGELKNRKINSSKYSRYHHNYMPLNLFVDLAKKTSTKYQELGVTDNYGKSACVKIPKKLNFKLAYIIGAMLGDGHLENRKGNGGEVVFSDLDRNSVNEMFIKTIKEVFGIDMKKEKSKGLVSYNSALTKILNILGMPTGNKSKKIHVPSYMFFADKDSIRGFIKGLFDTGGSASKHGFSIASTNGQFIQELKWLFLRLGITGNIEKRLSKGEIDGRNIKKTEISSFRVSGRDNLKKFLEANPDKEKCSKLMNTMKNTKKPGTRSKEIIPIPKLMEKIREENKGKEKTYKFRCLSVNNLRDLSKNIEGDSSKKLKELIDMPIRWVKIKEKKKIPKEKEVYDLTVENHHNFVANSLVTHNCIANDLKKNLYSLEDVCLLIEDEAHRCVKNYDYNFIAQKYKSQAENKRIIGLTASPGNNSEKTKKICQNLSIEEVELRTRESPDVKQYLQERETEKHTVMFPAIMEELRKPLKELTDKYIQELVNRKVIYSPKSANKTELIKLQGKIMDSVNKSNTGENKFNYLQAASAIAQVIKLQHAQELLETQSLQSFIEYLKNLFQQAAEKKSKGVQKLVKKQQFTFLYNRANELKTKEIEHPKVEELERIVKKEVFSKEPPEENPEETNKETIENKGKKTKKIIVFTQFRETASLLAERLDSIKGIKTGVFVGQAKKSTNSSNEKNKKAYEGLNQKKQKQMIQQFSNGEINVLISTSIGEEGLDIPEVNAVVFYEPIPSAIRKIQRAGRTARLMQGKMIVLITKKTRDEAFYYISKSREKKMYSTIGKIKRDLSDNNLLSENSDESKDHEEKSEKGNNKEEKKINKNQQKSLYDFS